jgi:hypothetical protein
MKPCLREAVLMLLCAAICAVQLVIPPYIGIANNGDWGKVYARFACGLADGGAGNFIFFVPDFEFGPQYYWSSAVLSSEILMAAGPILLVKAAGGHVFNIRWLGALHATLFVAAYYMLLLYLRRYGPRVQVGVGMLALWIFGDVAYISYFNSFYSDTAAMLGLLLMMLVALSLAADPEPGRGKIWLFGAAAALFVTSKPQHGIWGFLPALFALAIAWRVRTLRTAGIAVCAVLLIAEAAVFWASPPEYQADPLFSLIFCKILPASPAPLQALRDLGLRDTDARYIGLDAYSAHSPFADPQWKAAFARRTSYRRVFAYWVRHPGEAIAVLRYDLAVNAPMIRAPNLSNFRREDGHPPGAHTRRFASWSDLRAWLYVHWPYHIVVWYLCLAAGAAFVWRRNPTARLSVALCLGLALIAVLEFVFASLTDAIETHRHLLLFHLMTDLTICFAAGWALHFAAGPRRTTCARSPAGTASARSA